MNPILDPRHKARPSIRQAHRPADDTRTTPPGWIARAARSGLRAALSRITWGRLTLIDGEDRFCVGADAGPAATITVHDSAFYADVALGGSVGAGEAYMAGRWSVDDLVAVVRILVRNREVMQGLEGGPAAIANAVLRLLHRLRDNSRAGSRRNIVAHYDLGNAFYRLFLDETMTYSAALFERPDMTLSEAQVAKIDRICRKLALRTGEHLLEIGSGWGALAIHAARNYGCRVTTITLSKEQHALATDRVATAGLADRISVQLTDYRDVTGSFDKLVSVEMIEAVGERWFDRFFQVCSDRLKPDGAMLLQAITIRDRFYPEALRSVDFIQRHVFPGCCIPSIAAMAERVARVTDLKICHLEDLTPHYAETLRRWRERFWARIDEVRALGYPEAFVRLWDYYLAYCEGGFHEHAIGNAQILLHKPLHRGRAPLGAL